MNKIYLIWFCHRPVIKQNFIITCWNLMCLISRQKYTHPQPHTHTHTRQPAHIGVEVSTTQNFTASSNVTMLPIDGCAPHKHTHTSNKIWFSSITRLGQISTPTTAMRSWWQIHSPKNIFLFWCRCCLLLLFSFMVLVAHSPYSSIDEVMVKWI